MNDAPISTVNSRIDDLQDQIPKVIETTSQMIEALRDRHDEELEQLRARVVQLERGR